MRQSILKQISIIITIALIISTMSAFVLPIDTKADLESNAEAKVESGEEEETTHPAPQVPDEYEMVAHRGYSGIAPENSSAAFDKAVSAGFTHIELDVRRCKENAEGKSDWVVSHDETLERLCGVNKKISSMTVSEIQKYPYKAGNNIAYYKNLKVLSLNDLITIINKYKSQNIDWRVEIKELDNDEEQEKKVFEEVVQPLIDADVIDCVTFISFDASILNKILKEDNRVKAWYLAKILDEDHLARAKSLKNNYQDRLEGVILKGTTYTTEEVDVETLLEENLKVGVYVLDSRVMMGSYYSMGVRSFTTNEVGPNSMSVNLMKKTYSIKDFDISLSKRSYTFTNTRKKPKFTISYEGQVLLEGLCFETSYSDNKYPGDATATASGLRNVTGEKDKMFTITMPKVKGFKISKSKANSIKYTWTANTDVKGYKVYQYNYKTKKYKLVKTITNSKTNKYTAKKLTSCTKYRFRVKTYVTYKKKTYRSSPCAGKTTYTPPGTESKIKMRRYKKGTRVKIKFGKLPRVTGYKVKLATDKNFTENVKNVTVKGKKHSVKFKKLKKKKTYYAMVRGYFKAEGKIYYGEFSKVVKKKGKKK